MAEFDRIRGVVRLSDGRLVVANGASNELRVFAANGGFLMKIGRGGTGPGEFSRTLWSLFRARDTVVATDNSGRAHVFAPNGQLLRSLPRPRIPGATGPPFRISLDSTGAFLLFAETSENGDPDPVPFVIGRESQDGAIAILTRVPAHSRPPSANPAAWARFGPTGKIASGRGRLCAGYTAAFAVTCFSKEGRVVLRLSRDKRSRRITEAERDLFRKDELAANRGADAGALARLEAELRIAVFAEFAPMFGRMIIATNGDLWIGDFDAADELGPRAASTRTTPVRWNAFGEMGEWLADLDLPARFTPYEFGFNYVTGVSFDASGLEHAVVFSFKR